MKKLVDIFRDEQEQGKCVLVPPALELAPQVSKWVVLVVRRV